MEVWGRGPSFRRSAVGSGIAAALLLAQGAATAQGNVSVLVDGHGDLRVFGDDQGNGLVLLYEFDTGELVVSGTGGTTVNGLPEIRPIVPGGRFVFDMGAGDDRVRFAVFEVGSCCNDREIVFFGGEGDDVFSVGDEESSLDRVFADMGPGNDRFHCGEGGFLGPLELHCGEGDDWVDGFYAFTRGTVSIDLGPGADFVNLGFHFADGPFTLTGGPGEDYIRFLGPYLRDSFQIDAGDGADVIELTEGLEDDGDGGPVLVDAAEGGDRILLGGLVDVAKGVTLQAGGDADVVTIEDADVRRGFAVSLGAGDDRLSVGGSGFAAPTPVVFDGAEGTDRFRSLRGNRYELVPEVLHFEGPMARQVSDTPPFVSTVLTGRVVAPGGAPVAAAVVTVSELGLSTSSAEDGTFLFDDLVIPFGRLELTAAATVRGRRMSTITAFRPAADTTTDLGDLVIVPTRTLQLVFGGHPYIAAWFAERLVELGSAPLDVVLETFLPADLSPFETIWHVGYTMPLTAGERDRLARFVRSGGGLHLASDYDAVRDTHELLVNRLLRDPDIDIVQYGSGSSSPIVYNPDVVGALAVWPNVLSTAYPVVGGVKALAGVEPENVFAIGASERVFFAAWSGPDLEGGRGRLSLGLTTHWFYSSFSLDAVENLRAFLRWEPDAFAVR